MIQTQSPLCIAQVGKYLDDRGPLPFVIQKSTEPLPGLAILKESFDATSQSYQVHLRNDHSNPIPVSIAIPGKKYPSVQIQIMGLEGTELAQASVGDGSKVQAWVSNATRHVLSLNLPVGKTIMINLIPSSNSITGINGIPQKTTDHHTPMEVKKQGTIFQKAGCVLLAIDSGWESAVNGVASRINQSKSLVLLGTTKVMRVAKFVLFH